MRVAMVDFVCENNIALSDKGLSELCWAQSEACVSNDALGLCHTVGDITSSANQLRKGALLFRINLKVSPSHFF